MQNDEILSIDDYKTLGIAVRKTAEEEIRLRLEEVHELIADLKSTFPDYQSPLTVSSPKVVQTGTRVNNNHTSTRTQVLSILSVDKNKLMSRREISEKLPLLTDECLKHVLYKGRDGAKAVVNGFRIGYIEHPGTGQKGFIKISA